RRTGAGRPERAGRSGRGRRAGDPCPRGPRRDRVLRMSPRATAVLLLALLAPAGVARAQDPAPRAGEVLVLEEMLVEGTIETPNAFYILNRARLGDDVLELRTSLLPLVVDSVERAPF